MELPAELWSRAATAEHRFLMLDYDGTVAPLRLRRERAAPPPRTLGLLASLARSERTRVAIVSGRPLTELAPFLGDLPIVMIGEHGWELRRLDGRIVRHPIPPDRVEPLARAAAAIADEDLAARIERKRSSLMLHTRGLSRDEAERIETRCARLWEPFAGGGNLRLRPVDGGLELRIEGRDKGTAVRELISESPPGTLSVYIGDDETDEDAFAAVSGTGFGILIAADGRPSRATGRLRSTAEVVPFLERWLLRVEGGHPSKPPPLRVVKP